MYSTKLIKQGNSRAVRLPQAMIKQLGIVDELQLELNGQTIVIRPLNAIKNPRADWGDDFKSADQEHPGADNELSEFIKAPLDSWDEKEWTW